MRLCGQDITIKECDSSDWNEAALGRMIEIKGQITMRAGLPKTIYESVLLHEIIHFIISTNQLRADAGEEHVVSVLANSLLAWMRDNPEIVKKIIGAKK